MGYLAFQLVSLLDFWTINSSQVSIIYICTSYTIPPKLNSEWMPPENLPGPNRKKHVLLHIVLQGFLLLNFCGCIILYLPPARIPVANESLVRWSSTFPGLLGLTQQLISLTKLVINMPTSLFFWVPVSTDSLWAALANEVPSMWPQVQEQSLRHDGEIEWP